MYCNWNTIIHPPAIKWKTGTNTTPESLRLLFLYLGISQSWSSTK